LNLSHFHHHLNRFSRIRSFPWISFLGKNNSNNLNYPLMNDFFSQCKYLLRLSNFDGFLYSNNVYYHIFSGHVERQHHNIFTFCLQNYRALLFIVLPALFCLFFHKRLRSVLLWVYCVRVIWWYFFVLFFLLLPVCVSSTFSYHRMRCNDVMVLCTPSS